MELNDEGEPTASKVVSIYSTSISYYYGVPIYFVGWDYIGQLRPASKLEN